MKADHSNVLDKGIRNGVNAGKTVTVHDTQITLNGWSGTGYTILDAESGAGAYMIGGGLDGGYIGLDKIGLSGLVFTSLTFLIAPRMPILVAAGVGLILAACLILIGAQLLYDQHDDTTATILCNYAFTLLFVGIDLALYPNIGLVLATTVSLITGLVGSVAGTHGCIPGRD